MAKFNLLFFIRLLMRHASLLLAVPIILALMVFQATKNEPKTFDSKARVYTGIASGSSIDLDNTKVDLFANNTAYDNLLNLIRARTTIEMVGVKLLAQHMALDSADAKIISQEKFLKLMEEVPDEVKDIVVKGDVLQTYQNFMKLKNSGHENYIYKLVNLDHPDYSIDKIVSRITVRRIMSSDFIDITFEADDPGICQNTLLILTDVFIELNAEMKANQSDVVVKYFEDQLSNSTSILNNAENELLKFNQNNNIINYYEQTKHIASEKESFELEYQRVKLVNEGSKSVLSSLNTKLDGHQRKSLANDEIIKIRDELAKVNFEISMQSISTKANKDDDDERPPTENLKKLKGTAKALEQQLGEEVNTVFMTDFDEDGLATSTILVDWLKATIEFEESKAQLKVMEVWRNEYTDTYQRYAPLGATMKRLERQISIAEQEYLSLLHSLGLAKLRQQNVQLKSNLKLVETPYFPIEPQASKRIMLVIVAFMAGFILVAFTLLVLEFLDGNINTSPRAENKIGLKVSSIFPVISAKNKKIDYDYLKNRAVNAISRNIILNQFKKEKNGMPQVNLIFSTQEDEGKTYICEHLINKFCELGYKILHITYDSKDFEQAPEQFYRKLAYNIDDSLYRISDLSEFDLNNEIKDFSAFDFVLLEIPGIIKNPFPVKLASVVDYSFLVTRANRAWSEADKNALDLFNEATTGPEPTVILNAVKVLEMETVVGDLPKRRSLLRKWVKRVVQFRFFNKKSIA